MTRFRSALIPLAIGLLSLTAVPQQALAAPPKPVPSVAAATTQQATTRAACAPTVKGTSVDARRTSLFTAYGNDNSRVDDWTGADGTYSLKLPNGREVWIFSDTFLGRINADGSRPPVVGEGGDTVFLNNSFAVENNGKLSTIHAGTTAQPTAVMPPRDANHWYWAGDGTVAGGIILGVTQVIGFHFDPGWGIWLGHIVFLVMLILRPRGLLPKTRGATET